MIRGFPAFMDRYTYATLWAVALGILLAHLAIAPGIEPVLVAGAFTVIVVETFLIDWLYASPTIR